MNTNVCAFVATSYGHSHHNVDGFWVLGSGLGMAMAMEMGLFAKTWQ